jgi:hypothetical protein
MRVVVQFPCCGRIEEISAKTAKDWSFPKRHSGRCKECGYESSRGRRKEALRGRCTKRERVKWRPHEIAAARGIAEFTRLMHQVNKSADGVDG